MTDAISEISLRLRDPLPISALDLALTAQFAVAWAGESGGEERRLGWWQSDLVSPLGGEDLFGRLTRATWKWAVFQAVREAARRRDAARESHASEYDRSMTLFSLGFELDERIEERLMELKRTTPGAREALPALNELVREGWKKDIFSAWVRAHGTVEYEETPVGRRIKGTPAVSLEVLVKRLVAGLDPIPNDYPRPHFRRAS